ncbi:MAG: phytoene/squalene synthase family protein, partial [Acidimicrobiales bacterium]
MNIDDAYARCEEITAAQARNFSYGIRLLPPPKRRAMSALYAMARRIDDIGDGATAPPVKLAGLADVRKSLAAVANRDPIDESDPVLVALSDVAVRYPLPIDALDELVDGCEMDVSGTEYQTFEELVGYC